MSTPYKDASIIASTSLISNYLVALGSLREFLENASDTGVQEFEALRYLIEDHREDIGIPLTTLSGQLDDAAERLENKDYA